MILEWLKWMSLWENFRTRTNPIQNVLDVGTARTNYQFKFHSQPIDASKTPLYPELWIITDLPNENTDLGWDYLSGINMGTGVKNRLTPKIPIKNQYPNPHHPSIPPHRTVTTIDPIRQEFSGPHSTPWFLLIYIVFIFYIWKQNKKHDPGKIGIFYEISIHNHKTKW